MIDQEYKGYKIDFVASEQHFYHHLVPIWRALPQYLKGHFYVLNVLKTNLGRKERRMFKNTPDMVDVLSKREENNFVLAAAYGEVSKLREKPIPMILMEHGVGQTYQSDHPSYSSGKGAKHNVFLFLSPNEFNTKGYQQTHPQIPNHIVGCPKLDEWSDLSPPNNTRPVVCVSFHWDCHVVPETRSTFQYYSSALSSLAENRRYRFIGHGHPRIFSKIAPFYKKWGIEPVQNFQEAVQRANMYVCDSSSTIYEFAYLDRPVVVLNAPFYRRNVEHGMRFWEYSNVGFNCDSRDDLYSTIQHAFENDDEVKDRRREIVEILYPYRGQAGLRAANVLEDFLVNFDLEPTELNQKMKANIREFQRTFDFNYARRTPRNQGVGGVGWFKRGR